MASGEAEEAQGRRKLCGGQRDLPTEARTLQSIEDRWQENRVALYCRGRYGLSTVYEYQELLLTLTEGPRRKVLGKTRRFRRAQRRRPEQPWRPR